MLHFKPFLKALLLLSTPGAILVTGQAQSNTEELFLKHLPDGRVFAQFEFSTSWDVDPLSFVKPSNVHHYGMFPKSLAEIVAHYKVQELHLTLTQGKWRTRMWGYPPYSVPPGAELWVWFQPNASSDDEWPGLVNALSGLLCAHLNVIGPESTFQPLHSFKPQGPIIGNLSFAQLKYAAVPRETVCTENFTPWTKLLPCGTSVGIASLFSALHLYNTDFHSLGVHFSPTCKDPECSVVGVKLVQTLTVVFPAPLNSRQFVEWSLKSLFSKAIYSACPLSTTSKVVIDKTDNSPAVMFVVDSPTSVGQTDGGRVEYDISNATESGKKFDVKVKSMAKYDLGMPHPPVLHTQRYLKGSGHEWGGLVTEIQNNHPTSKLKVLFLDTIPWYFRVFLHTLCVDDASLLYQHYQPAKDRVRGHMLELLLSIPPKTTASVSVQINRAFLKWTEHPPDAHHGFYVNSAVLTTVLDELPNSTFGIRTDNRPYVLRVHTEPLLISIATPDFSMPYNVICFVCTVIAIGFGSIFNLTTRVLIPETEGKNGMISRLFGFFKFRMVPQQGTSSQDVGNEKKEVDPTS